MMSRGFQRQAILGIPGQGTSNPHSIFWNHALAVVHGKFYDPSYGKIFTSLLQVDDESFDGYVTAEERQVNGKQVIAWLIRKNTLTVLDIKERYTTRPSY